MTGGAVLSREAITGPPRQVNVKRTDEKDVFLVTWYDDEGERYRIAHSTYGIAMVVEEVMQLKAPEMPKAAPPQEPPVTAQEDDEIPF